MNVTVIVSVEETADREATWIEEAIFYSLGKSRVMQWLDRCGRAWSNLTRQSHPES